MKELNKLLLSGLALILAGCAARGTSTGTTAAPDAAAIRPVPASARTTITLINAQYRFAVIDFAGHSVPAAGTRLVAYRDNKRVGAVRLTEPIRSGLATADILEGELRVGDEIR